MYPSLSHVRRKNPVSNLGANFHHSFCHNSVTGGAILKIPSVLNSEKSPLSIYEHIFCNVTETIFPFVMLRKGREGQGGGERRR